MQSCMNLSEHTRLVVVGLVWNPREQLLLCKMKSDRGVFPGEWGLPGGGVEPGESLSEALHREMDEELGLEKFLAVPAYFKEGEFDKLLPDGSTRHEHLIFFIYHCLTKTVEITLNEEFSEYCWVGWEEIYTINLNAETLDTLESMGLFAEAWDYQSFGFQDYFEIE